MSTLTSRFSWHIGKIKVLEPFHQLMPLYISSSPLSDVFMVSHYYVPHTEASLTSSWVYSDNGQTMILYNKGKVFLWQWKDIFNSNCNLHCGKMKWVNACGLENNFKMLPSLIHNNFQNFRTTKIHLKKLIIICPLASTKATTFTANKIEGKHCSLGVGLYIKQRCH